TGSPSPASPRWARKSSRSSTRTPAPRRRRWRSSRGRTSTTSTSSEGERPYLTPRQPATETPAMTNAPHRLLRAGLILGALGLGAPPLTAPANGQSLRLESASLPAPLLEGDGGATNTVIEASGVEPIGDGRRFLVAHDKAPGLFVVDAATGRILGPPITSPKFPAPSATGPKWEGMARDSAGNYYLIGAHNGKTDEERATK